MFSTRPWLIALLPLCLAGCAQPPPSGGSGDVGNVANVLVDILPALAANGAGVDPGAAPSAGASAPAGGASVGSTASTSAGVVVGAVAGVAAGGWIPLPTGWSVPTTPVTSPPVEGLGESDSAEGSPDTDGGASGEGAGDSSPSPQGPGTSVAARFAPAPPVDAPITDPFGWSSWRGRNHDGLDYGVGVGTPVRAAEAGTVTAVAYDGGYGNYVIVEHAEGFLTTYNHLDSSSVSVGQQVEQGEVLARSGQTGAGTGPHLHFEIWKPGPCSYPVVGERCPVDPVLYL